MRSYDRLAIMWRFARQVTPAIARDKAEKAAAAFGGRSLGFMLPLPGPGVSRILFSPNTICVPTQFDKQQKHDKALAELFTNAAEAKPEPISCLKEDLMQNGVATLLKGRPKKGKSLVACDFSAAISRGGEWYDGTPIKKPGSVIFGELEDPRNMVLARLRAAGANMTKIELLNDAVDLSKQREVDKIAAMAARLGDCRLWCCPHYYRSSRRRITRSLP